ncbi:MAG: hypothetical protein H6737_06115 [Alphaproteobacteria bacterium]|nr:hypothetical protein [Alphaproteobacteria bacterium]
MWLLLSLSALAKPPSLDASVTGIDIAHGMIAATADDAAQLGVWEATGKHKKVWILEGEPTTYTHRYRYIEWVKPDMLFGEGAGRAEWVRLQDGAGPKIGDRDVRNMADLVPGSEVDRAVFLAHDGKQGVDGKGVWEIGSTRVRLLDDVDAKPMAGDRAAGLLAVGFDSGATHIVGGPGRIVFQDGIPITEVRLSDDGSRIAIALSPGEGPGTVVVRTLPDGAELARFETEVVRSKVSYATAEYTRLAFAGDQLVVYGAGSWGAGQVETWDLATSTMVHHFDGFWTAMGAGDGLVVLGRKDGSLHAFLPDGTAVPW